MTEPISDEDLASYEQAVTERAAMMLGPDKLDALIARLRAAEADRDAALARAVPEAALVDKLRPYLRHRDWCARFVDKPCSCGPADLLTETGQ